MSTALMRTANNIRLTRFDMPRKKPTGDVAYGSRIRAVREALGLNQTDFGARFGVGQGAVGQWETGLTLPTSKNILALSRLGAVAPGAEPDRDLQTVPVGPAGSLPIRHKVAAGVWREIDEFADEPEGYAPITPRPDIEITDQWAEQVVGDSFSMRYPEGTLLHVRAAWGADPLKLHGRRVIIERTRDGGQLRERTVKEIVVTKNGDIELWGRSYNAQWNKPIRWKDGLREGDTVEIVGIVLSATLME